MLRPQMGLLLEASQPTSPVATHGAELASLLQVVVALLVVSALAYGVLRVLARRGFGRLPSQGSLRVEQRLNLDSQGDLLVVRVEGRRLLLAAQRGAPARLIAELGPAPEGTEP
ncbi:MAG: flagellar biosynthetic protein FliO [Myxococcales bacterium]